jgi:hypothetical protein
VKEESVFWLGGRPGKRQAEAPPPAAGMESAVLAACTAEGLVTEEFVAALGGYGSWLVSVVRHGDRQRIVWNGRESKLVLQEPVRTGGWRDLCECPVGQTDETGLRAAIASLLSAANPRSD